MPGKGGATAVVCSSFCEEWLAGYNGGPLRAPMMRIPDRLMKSLRAGLEASGLPVTADPDSEFMAGRNPA